MLSTPTTDDFRSDCVVTFEEAVDCVAKLKDSGKTVGLCHGGFDLLHPGHMAHFRSAKELCDVLIVSVTSDRFVTSRKGLGRPIFSEQLRAFAVACQEAVDYVVVTDFKKGTDVIRALKPSYYIKGPDFIQKTTPGISAEREAIKAVGGEMRYTNDPKLGTTEIIEYIKQELDVPHVLVLLDRDGTLIENDDFFGKEGTWREDLRLNKPVVDALVALKTKAKCTFVVVTNQTGVARQFFTEERVKEINAALDAELRKRGIEVASWQYCPDADRGYAEQHPDYGFDPAYVKEQTKRKPSTAMVDDALAKLNMQLSDFSAAVMVGNSRDDEGLATALDIAYVDVTGKDYSTILEKINYSLLKSN